jgi:hypothetical protein
VNSVNAYSYSDLTSQRPRTTHIDSVSGSRASSRYANARAKFDAHINIHANTKDSNINLQPIESDSAVSKSVCSTRLASRPRPFDSRHSHLDSARSIANRIQGHLDQYKVALIQAALAKQQARKQLARAKLLQPNPYSFQHLVNALRKSVEYETQSKSPTKTDIAHAYAQQVKMQQFGLHRNRTDDAHHCSRHDSNDV